MQKSLLCVYRSILCRCGEYSNVQLTSDPFEPSIFIIIFISQINVRASVARVSQSCHPGAQSGGLNYWKIFEFARSFRQICLQFPPKIPQIFVKLCPSPNSKKWYLGCTLFAIYPIYLFCFLFPITVFFHAQSAIFSFTFVTSLFLYTFVPLKLCVWIISPFYLCLSLYLLLYS